MASHIRDIRDYLSRDDALLPNAVIVAFLEGVKIKDLAGEIDKLWASAWRKNGSRIDELEAALAPA